MQKQTNTIGYHILQNQSNLLLAASLTSLIASPIAYFKDYTLASAVLPMLSFNLFMKFVKTQNIKSDIIKKNIESINSNITELKENIVKVSNYKNLSDQDIRNLFLSKVNISNSLSRINIEQNKAIYDANRAYCNNWYKYFATKKQTNLSSIGNIENVSKNKLALDPEAITKLFDQLS